MKVLGIIPARYGSTRLEGKPLMDICGKPMIQHVYEQAKKALTDVLVATDDKRIEKTVKDFGGNVVMTSNKHNTGTNRCLEAYEIFKANAFIDFDVIINIQGDEPLLEPQQIKQIIACFEDSRTEMATLVIPVNASENLFEGGVFVVIDKNNNALYFSRSVIPFVRDADKNNWQQQHIFYKHVGMYAFTPNALQEFANLPQTTLEIAESLEQNRWLENGNNIKVAKTEFETIAVDTMEDLERVRNIIMKKN
ncbi:3-deoxy-manno-octulosonate cytidylyltransferase [Aureibaculum sp. 2210JD6-5]|uniref:3-deoxy-manno-octulosonate cytidylyltransferase n=1 Tax=Aureibaculum sp. 2210JD6-5 TaxID=3103957 RepID=UPI002AADA886|nr:3-deoxy-manno-octulosonate cytidylyltransferase [Aureibaculum sp. 2210JD6-5]MDY7394469.1 3-deoxy-manno-octulosonate cytidylyltransferase [Aureibaculum sp. 2210JD6-5]